MPYDWSSRFMGPARFGIDPMMMSGGYALQPYDPRAAVLPMIDAARTAQAAPPMPTPDTGVVRPRPMGTRPRLFGDRPGGPVADRRMVDRGYNTGHGFFADLRAFRDKLNPFGPSRSEARGGMGGALGANTPSGRDKPGPGGLIR